MSETSDIAFVDYDKVKKIHGEPEAKQVYRQIAKIAGGDPDPAHEGGMDLTGLSDSAKARIAKLLEKPKEKAPAKAPAKTK